MKGSDAIVRFLADAGVTDVFGYPGGMVTHLMESLDRQDLVRSHVCAHEQGAAFEACGYARTTGGPGVAYATSGPGATNLVTGICDAWFDSVPVVFLTGQVNTFELSEGYPVRQRGFQETDVIGMVRGVTKWAHRVDAPEDLLPSLRRAFRVANDGRKGPVLLDIPMDIQRKEVAWDAADDGGKAQTSGTDALVARRAAEELGRLLRVSRKPCVLVGAGVKQAAAIDALRSFLSATGIPAVSSMNAIDALAGVEDGFGFIGAYGMRAANFIAARCDLLLVLGSRLDVRQAGASRGSFAPDARILRVDIDADELSYPVRDDLCFRCDVSEMLREALGLDLPRASAEWVEACHAVRRELTGMDDLAPNEAVRRISLDCPDNAVVTADVGQNQVWVAQSFGFKPGQIALFSGGHGAMGFSLPAAIGACVATGRPVVCFTGDGGFQMNMQELALLARGGLPVTVFVLNNRALGMIRHFQEMYFDSNYAQTVDGRGYSTPDFGLISRAYGIPFERVPMGDSSLGYASGPRVIEVVIDGPTYVFPKLRFGSPNQDQEPLMPRELYAKLMELTK